MNNHKQTNFYWFILLTERLITRRELEFDLASRIQNLHFGRRLLPKEAKTVLLGMLEPLKLLPTSYSWLSYYDDFSRFKYFFITKSYWGFKCLSLLPLAGYIKEGGMLSNALIIYFRNSHYLCFSLVA